jgi:protein CpxP
MKASKISLIAALIAGVMFAYSPALRAQDAKKHEGRPGMRQHFDKMAEDLKLTDEQKTKVQALFKSQAEKGRAIREDSSLTDAQKREKGKALREDMTKGMKEILTSEQFAQWEKMRPQGRPGGFGGQRKSGGADK